jgi:hypothetical protein
MDGFIIPSSIQRVRSFLVEMYGMKVKPWANTEETLAALHAMLVARQHCDRFWASLQELLGRLAADLKKREAAAPGTLLDNEVLDSQRYQALLQEIRACLAQQSSESTGSFRRLASGLSAPALGLLLLLGGAATVGCDNAALKGATKTQDAAAQAADAKGAPPETKTDAPVFVLPDVPPIDKPPIKTPVAPDVAPPWDAVTVGADGAMVTIQDIMSSCNVGDRDESTVLRCLSFLRASWTTGLAQELAGQSCAAVTSRLAPFEDWNCEMSGCEPPQGRVDPDFTAGDVPYCRPVILYLGVRFV